MMARSKKAVIIVAGGSGSRMASSTPKQFLELAGKPVLMHSIERFYAYDPAIEIILVLPEDQMSTWEQLLAEHNFTLSHKKAKGGKERFFSVKNGLDLLGEDVGVVAVHDGVRPLVNNVTITLCFNAAVEKGSAVPVVKLNDSIRRVKGEGSKAKSRDKYRLVQTPQCFKKEILIKAYQQYYSENFTDDASLVEAAGFPIALTEGNPENLKITNPVDLKIAEVLLEIKK